MGIFFATLEREIFKCWLSYST